MSRMKFGLLAGLLLVTAACKGVDDWLVDLKTVEPQTSSKTNIFDQAQLVFDAGQLVHEALVGLADAEEMKPWQAVRALYHGSNTLKNATNDALLRADGAVLIGRMATRIPVPPIAVELVDPEHPVSTPLALIEKIDAARAPLMLDTEIPELASPDETRRQSARDNVKKYAPEQTFKTPEEWRAWWDGGERKKRLEVFVQETAEYRRQLGSFRYKNASSARAVLGYLVAFLEVYAAPEVITEMWPAIMNIGRQVVVMSLNESMNDQSPLVRGDVAEAMAMVRDPSFAEPLARSLSRDRDPVSATKTIRALNYYPSRRTILVLIYALQYEDQRIRELAGQVLQTITGEKLLPEYDAWNNWWNDRGAKSWL